MKKVRLFLPLLLLFILVILAFIWFALRELPLSTQLANGAKWEWHSCEFDSNPLQPIFCGTLYPSHQPEGLIQPLQLPVILLKRSLWHWWQPASPILYLTGGPGGSAGLSPDFLPYWQHWQQTYAQDQHDLVIYDPRGTGLSQPAIDCPEFATAMRSILDQAIQGEEELQRIQAAYQACQQRLQAENIDLAAFNTLTNTQDVGDLMATIGGEAWNLYGASYGTRLALSVMRTYPERLRSAVLDSVYPPEKNTILSIPLLFDKALQRLFQACETQRTCREAFPDLSVAFLESLAQLQLEPLATLLPSGEEMLELTPVTITDYRFLYILFQALYSPDLLTELPLAIDDIRQGSTDSFILPSAVFFEMLFDPSFSDAVNLSVDCADTQMEITQAQYQAQLTAEQQAHPQLKAFLMAQWQYHPCYVWPVDDVGADFRQPVHSDLPTLLLAGYYDPVTPVEWAQETVSRLSQGHLVIFNDVGHGVLDFQPCAAVLTAQFWHDPQQPPRRDKCVQSAETLEFSVRY